MTGHRNGRDEVLYQHAESTRRPIVAVATLLAGALTTTGWRFGAPTPFLGVLGLTTLMSAWLFVQGRRSGCRVDRVAAAFFAGTWQRAIPLRELEGYRVTSWTDGRPWVHLRTRNAPEWLVPAYCIGDPGAFVAALDRLGVPQAH